MNKWLTRMKKIHQLRGILFILLMISFNTNAANNNPKTLAECKSGVSRTNKELPQKIDKFSTLLTMNCSNRNGRNTIIYYYQLSQVNLTKYQENDKSNIRTTTETWCSREEQKILLKQIDVMHVYKDLNGTVLGEFVVKIEDC